MDNNSKAIDETNDPPSDNQLQEACIEIDLSTLSISSSGASTSSNLPTVPPYPPFTPVETLPKSDEPQDIPTITPIRRRKPTKTPAEETAATIPPPYPWAGDRRCRVHTLKYLNSQKILHISGEVHCEKCDGTYEVQYNLQKKFSEVTAFVYANVEEMHHRAHTAWMNPVLLNCQLCKEENSARPVIAENKQKINWLFLLLGQMLGFCSTNQLRYFCRHTGNYLTGGKDAVLFRVYMDLCRQVDPTEAFYV